VLAGLALGGVLAPSDAFAQCGSPGQRACCLGEAGFGACVSSAVEVPGCSGSCTCGGFNPLGIQASSRCVAATPCGGVNQRACCVGEGRACDPGLVEQPRSNSGFCTNSTLGIQSSGICRATTACGGEGERACCVGEAGFGACEAGLVEIEQPNSGQCSNLPWGIQSNGICEVVSACGGSGERACCLGEAGFGACKAGLVEVPQPNAGQCGNLPFGIQSSGVCEPVGAELGRPCGPLVPCASGLVCDPLAGFVCVDQSVSTGEACGPLVQCDAGLFCDPLAGFRCVAAAGLDQPCGPGVPCEGGLSCTSAFRCANSPSRLGETCGPGFACDSGLYCQPGLPSRCRALRRPGEGCSVANPCEDGLSCEACFVNGCNAPFQCFQNRNQGALTEQQCRALRSPALAKAAEDLGLAMTYAAGDEIAALVGESQAFGVAYGADGRYGCFTTLCGGINADVGIEAFGTVGFYETFDDVGGSSFANFQEAQTPGNFLNFSTSQVFSRLPGEIIPSMPVLIGTEDSLSIGVGPDLLPFSAGSFLCETVLDTVIDPASTSPELAVPAPVVANASFPRGLAGWICVGEGTCAWSPEDASGSAGSGSAQVTSGTSPGGVGWIESPCIGVTPGVPVSITALAQTHGARPGAVQADFRAGLACEGDSLGLQLLGEPPADGAWHRVGGSVAVPRGAQSLKVAARAESDSSSGAVSTTRLDQILVPEPGAHAQALGALLVLLVLSRCARRRGRAPGSPPRAPE